MYNCFAHSKFKKYIQIHFHCLISGPHTAGYSTDKRRVFAAYIGNARGSMVVGHFAWKSTSFVVYYAPISIRRQRQRWLFAYKTRSLFHPPAAAAVLYNIRICVYLARFERRENSKRKRKTRRRRRRLMQIELKTFGFVREGEEEAAARLSSGRRQTRMQMRLRNIYCRTKWGSGEVI